MEIVLSPFFGVAELVVDRDDGAVREQQVLDPLAGLDRPDPPAVRR